MNAILIKTWLVTFGIGGAILLAGARTPADPDGRTIFLDSKCSNCHTLQAQGIGNPDPASRNDGPPDLSTIGERHDADWIARFLLKKESIEGRKHMVKFKGSDEELATLAAWLHQQIAKTEQDTSR
jgi:mono/diheme cytochrome c family protein